MRQLLHRVCIGEMNRRGKLLLIRWAQSLMNIWNSITLILEISSVILKFKALIVGSVFILGINCRPGSFPRPQRGFLCFLVLILC
jgi:hypothetical protein